MRTERERKIFLTRVSIAVIMAAVVVLWLLNARNLLAPRPESGSESKRSMEIEQLKEDFARELTGAKAKLEKAREQSEKDKADKLIDDLEKRAADWATSSATIATTMATGTSANIASSSLSGQPSIKNNNCPEYIDCMPSIGAPKDCSIPAGCEGITQIAY